MGVAVAVVLAIGGVVLARIGDDIAQRESVMGGEEVDARGRPPVRRENIGRTGKPRGQRPDAVRVAPPEAAHIVAVPVVPLGQPAGKPPSR